MLDVSVTEGNRAKKGDVIARLDTRDVDIALQRAQADRDGADAQLRLLQAGSRPEDIRQAEAQALAAASEATAAQSELTSRKRTSSASSSCYRATPVRRSSGTMPPREEMWREIAWIRRGRARAPRAKGRRG